jgi:ELWxxDGT repeat protein
MNKILFLVLICINISFGQMPVLVKNLNPIDEAGDLRNPVKMGNSAFFTSKSKLYKTDGTAANTVLMKDFSDNFYAGTIIPSALIVVGTNVFFKVIYTPTAFGPRDIQLWKTDGTTIGTLLVKDFLINDILNGNSSAAIGNILIFDGSDNTNGTELWRSDGTLAGTVLIKDIDPTVFSYPISSNPNGLFNLNGIVYFQASIYPNSFSLWKTDGTLAGTVKVKDFPTGFKIEYGKIVDALNKFYFVLFNDSTKSRDLWVSDGSEPNTYLVKQMSANNSFYSYSFQYCNGYLYFSSEVTNATNNNALWKTDGTVSGTTLVYNDVVSNDDRYQDLTCSNNKLYFTIYRSGNIFYELFITDGTTANTISLLNNISASRIFEVGNQTLFFGTNSLLGTELYKTDGTVSGTSLVKDIITGPSSGISGAYSIVLNNKLIFSALDPVFNIEPFVSDGTEAGTTLLKNTQDQGSGSFPSKISKIGDKLFFATNSYFSFNDSEAWLSDGTEVGTQFLKDLRSVNGGPTQTLNIDGTNFYFKSQGNQLFKSDGTASGTQFLHKYNSDGNMVYLNNTLYFSDFTNGLGIELYKEVGGVVSLVKDINLGADDSNPNELTILNNFVYFFATDNSATGRELWKTDGTTVGTTLVEDINEGFVDSTPSGLDISTEKMINFNNNLYFLRTNDIQISLYKSNGNTGGLEIMKSFLPTELGLFIDKFYIFKNELYFLLRYNPANTQLWKTDGTAIGTTFIKQIPGYNTFSFLTNGNKFYFYSTLKANIFSTIGHSFWVSDGTTNGTIEVAKFTKPLGTRLNANTTINDVLAEPVYEINISESNAAILSPTEVVFSFVDKTNGLELWKTDGTIANTAILADINPGFANSSPVSLINFKNAIYFAATTGTDGPELFKINAMSILPLDLLSFNGKSENNQNILTWQTANEVALSHFDIERGPLAPDGRNTNMKFEKIGEVKANGGPSENVNYEFIDQAPPAPDGGALYRLRMVDLDGKFKYSKIINLENKQQSEIKIYPNPTSDYFSISGNQSFEKLQIVDAAGRIVKEFLPQNDNKYGLKGVGAGVYLLRIIDNNRMINSKIFIK